MKTRHIKLQLILWSMVLLVGVYFGFSYFTSSASAQTERPGVNDPIVTDPDDHEPDITDPDSEEPVDIPNDPIKLVNYGINILNSGKGYQSNYTFDVYNTGTYQGFSITVTQRVDGTMSKCGTEAFEESFYYYQCPPEFESLLVDNEILAKKYVATNVDTALDKVYSVSTRVCDENSRTYDLTNATKYEATIEEGLKNFRNIQAMGFPIEFKTSNTQVLSYDTRSNKNYAYITLSYNVKTEPWYLIMKEKYRQYVNLETVSKSYTFTINKHNGYIKQIRRNEEASARIKEGGFDVKVNSSSLLIQTFTHMNKEVSIKKPYLECV